jgi:DNA-binding HxlR family transcriptional regulator
LSDNSRAKPYTSRFRILFRKGTAEVILFLASVEKARYSDIRKQGYVIGDRSLSRILKELQKQALINRETLPTYPVSTAYSLTDKGKLVAKQLNILKETL